MNFWPFRWSTPSSVRSPRQGRRKASRLELEALEDRFLPSATTISGFVYHDANNDGLYETPPERPFANIQLALQNAAGTTVATAVTDANGYYAFTTDSTIDTSPHTQTFTTTFPSTLTNYNLTGQLPQFDPSLGTLQSVTITNAGAITSDIRVENTSNTSGTTITGTVGGNLSLTGPGVNLVASPERDTGSFNASTFDGTLDFAGTSGTDFGPRTASATRSLLLTGAAVDPFLGTGQVSISESAVATSTASGGGNVLVGITSSASASVTVTYTYTPSNALRPGNYTIVEVTQPWGTFSGKDSSNGVVLSNPPGQDIIPITVTGPDMPHNDFGKLLPASLSGFVYLDTGPGGTNDGIKEPGEPGIPNVPVTLTGTSDTGAVSIPAVTDASGFYHFDNLRPGTYTITETQPAGYIDGKDTVGTQGGLTGNDVFYGIALTQGIHGSNNNFGELTPVVSATGSPPAADLQIVKTAGAASVPVGSALTYTLTVSNLGPNAAAGVTVRDTLPPGVTFVSAAGAAGWQDSASGGVVTFTTGSLAAGASAVLTVTILAPGTTGYITNVSTVASTTPDANPNNNTSQVTVAVVAAPPPTGPSEQVYAPTPATFPGPGDITVIGKTSLFNDSGAGDPNLMAQISFIDGLYRTLLGRPSDSAGLIYWVQQLRAGMPRDAIVQSFWTSAAHRDMEIETLYRTYLNRDAGAADFAYWNSVFAGGASETDVATMILTSAEYTARVPDNASFIDSLYRSALGRPSDAAGVIYWGNVIASGGRALAARAILLSDEATNRLLTFVFAQDLHRGISDGERQFWIGEVHAGLQPQDICRMVLASGEFYALATQASQG